MFNIGDVVAFKSIEAGKLKYHLCISLNSHFLFINSPKKNAYPGDFVTSASDFPFLPSGPSQSVISCSLVMQIDDASLKRMGAKKLGSAPIDTIKRLFRFIQQDQTIPEETKERIMEGLADWM